MTISSIIISPKHPVSACVIWLHGLGADGNDFASIVPQLGLPDTHGIEFVFPNAPQSPVTINGGIVMPSWYDILQMSLDREVDLEGLQQSCQSILQLATPYAEKVGWNNIIFAGFSQGGAVAAHMLEILPKAVAGILCLSTYAMHQLKPSCPATDIHALVNHGEFDQVVPCQLGHKLSENLKTAGLQVQTHTYPMEHQVCLQQIELIGLWINERLPGDSVA